MVDIKIRSDNALERSEINCCGICEKQFAKYTCPRCNARYCSLECYRSEKHAQCSETFYKDCFLEALKEKSASPKEKHQMLEMLKRLESSHTEDPVDAGSDENTPTLEERLSTLNLDFAEPDAIWDCLNDHEKQDFQQLLESGEMASSIELYKPWWECSDHIRPLVEEVENGSRETEHMKLIPDVLDDIPPFSSLLKTASPAPQLKYNLLSILYSYCYTVRLYNGDHVDVSVESAQAVLDLCPVFSQNAAYSSVTEAVHHSLQTCQKHPHLFGSSEHSTSILIDVIKILSSTTPSDRSSSQSDFLHATLSDLYRLFEAASRETKSATSRKERDDRVTPSDRELKRSLKLAAQKVYFFLSYVASGRDELTALIIPLQLEHERITSELRDHEILQSKMEKQRAEMKAAQAGGHQKPIVEELS